MVTLKGFACDQKPRFSSLNAFRASLESLSPRLGQSSGLLRISPALVCRVSRWRQHKYPLTNLEKQVPLVFQIVSDDKLLHEPFDDFQVPVTENIVDPGLN